MPTGSDTQTRICFANITGTLAEADMGSQDVVHVPAFVTERSHMAENMRARDAWLAGTSVLPSSTLLIVSGVTRREFVVEVEVWAAAH